ncbi:MULTISPECIES: DUF6463 family protein [unclassified Pseudoalteromonas]|uniref:DUF6463 family protein n=1 Tax=unclassified Pseudoalteromonas TaxID=194690 RepID=UPI0020985E6C|nr:DUF6463 family protein [Pseudoalteromonas sp. XMcav2-N]MCO7187953.1 DUF6463 family protein [Pseudoalteromonas sp. XMcav2-N]
MNRAAFLGNGLIFTGLLHNLVGILMGWEVLTAMHQEGWFATTVVNGSMLFDREAIVWFLSSGVLFLLLGSVLRQLSTYQIPVPGLFAPSLTLFGVVLAIIMPFSGAYLLILLGALSLLKDKFWRRPSHLS